MKVYIDVKVNGHWVSPMVEVTYTVEPIDIFSVVLGSCEIIHTLDDYDIQHLTWCAEQDHMGTGVKRRSMGAPA
jgi:hypothetical protein